MSRRIDSAEFAQLFTEFADPAFRLETLPEYREPHEQDAIRRFTDGRPPDDDWISGYLELSRGARNDGKRLQRVRVLDRPPTDYQPFLMDLASRCNVPAGEDLRVLGRGDALALGVEAGSDF